MKNNNNNNNTLYLSQWKNHSIDEMIETYITPRKKLLNPLGITKCINPEEPIYETEKIKNVNTRILKLKFMSMSDIIINRCYGCNGNARFSTKIFQSIYGDYYKRMLQVLNQIGVIEIDYQYDSGKARTIWLKDWNTTTNKINSATLLKYKNKLKECLSKINNNKHLPQIIASRYKVALKNVKFDKEKALEYVNKKYSGRYEIILGSKNLNDEEMEGYKNWRIGFINGFSTKEEPTRDSNGRIYHPLTNMPKDLLPFANINYEMDAANCHPILFVVELMKYYKIDNETLLTISEYPLPDDDEFYNNYLSMVNLLSKNIKCKLPKDVIEYILLVFKGKFWDINLRKYDIDDRTEIKKNFFSEVFYSYNNTTVIRNEQYIIIKRYAKDFRKCYPHVWKVLGIIKKNGKKQLVEEKKREDHNLYEIKREVIRRVFGEEIKSCEDDNVKVKVKNNVLPNSLMKLESQIFIKILKKLLPNYDVINIHDAIVVIDTPKNKMLTPDIVEKTMLEVFAQYKLYPTIKKSIPTEEF